MAEGLDAWDGAEGGADEASDEHGVGAPAWAAFGDLMAGVLGAFVLVLGAALVGQLDLANRLEAEVQQRRAEQQQREALERALAGPLADVLKSGRITLAEGRIGISGAVLFAPGSAELHPDGLSLLRRLAAPLARYLSERGEVLMVSGFTDDRALATERNSRGKAGFADNWELSAQRALTVTRTLIDQGLPADAVFAAAFGPQQPVASNEDAAGRALNRRVEMQPTARPQRAPSAAAPSQSQSQSPASGSGPAP